MVSDDTVIYLPDDWADESNEHGRITVLKTSNGRYRCPS